MKLLAVRSLDVNDPMPLLGRKVETKPLPEPITPMKKVAEGVWMGKDGKFETHIPVNERARALAPTTPYIPTFTPLYQPSQAVLDADFSELERRVLTELMTDWPNSILRSYFPNDF